MLLDLDRSVNQNLKEDHLCPLYIARDHAGKFVSCEIMIRFEQMKFNEIGKFFRVKVLRKLFLKTNLIFFLPLMTYDVNAQVIIGDTTNMEYHSLNVNSAPY